MALVGSGKEGGPVVVSKNVLGHKGEQDDCSQASNPYELYSDLSESSEDNSEIRRMEEVNGGQYGSTQMVQETQLQHEDGIALMEDLREQQVEEEGEEAVNGKEVGDDSTGQS